MRTRILLFSLCACSLLLCSTVVTAAVQPTAAAPKGYDSVFELEANDLINLEKEDLEAKVGRKLKFKEKLSLGLVKRKLKKNKQLSGVDALEQTKTDGLAVAGLVTGIVGLFFLGIILGTLAIVFSAIALKRIRREPETRTGRGLAIAGLVLGIVGVVGWALVVAALIAG